MLMARLIAAEERQEWQGSLADGNIAGKSKSEPAIRDRDAAHSAEEKTIPDDPFLLGLPPPSLSPVFCKRRPCDVHDLGLKVEFLED
ncbi:hypothetical protein AVEN_155224-1 [Araneus ventricosus]|uniref:Uncharacterized protein n=1 Tax=Araneus ventricosus TaxID=182803 RepID=A0A4Y2EK72_ARAVE|nr:hypothetical protein AVEN_155224-1 [Araneus ventricosus]